MGKVDNIEIIELRTLLECNYAKLQDFTYFKESVEKINFQSFGSMESVKKHIETFQNQIQEINTNISKID